MLCVGSCTLSLALVSLRAAARVVVRQQLFAIVAPTPLPMPSLYLYTLRQHPSLGSARAWVWYGCRRDSGGLFTQIHPVFCLSLVCGIRVVFDWRRLIRTPVLAAPYYIRCIPTYLECR